MKASYTKFLLNRPINVERINKLLYLLNMAFTALIAAELSIFNKFLWKFYRILSYGRRNV